MKVNNIETIPSEKAEWNYLDKPLETCYGVVIAEKVENNTLFWLLQGDVQEIEIEGNLVYDE